MRRWAIQAEIDDGTRAGVTTAENEQIKKLKAENARLREDVAILKSGRDFLRGGTRPPQPLIMGFIEAMRSEGRAALVDLRGPEESGLPDRRANVSGMADSATLGQNSQ